MDKTVSISLGGFSFIVDDRAFFKLKNYLDEIRHSLHGMEGTEDILADVEVRIAELFKERLGAREVVNEQDVDHIVGIMGRPEQYVDEDNEEAQGPYRSTGSSHHSSTGERVKKKLYRDPDDKVIAGVLSGLAHYLGVETWVTRVIFIVLMFSDMFISLTSISVISYIVLWIILPKADTASQKYEMFGQAGDFETIKKNANLAASEMKGVARDASGTLTRFFQILFKIILIFIGVMLISTGIGLIIGSVALLISATTEIPVQFFGYFVDYPWQEWTTKLIAFLLITIPAILCILIGFRLISDRFKINKTFVFSSFALWLLSMIAGAVLFGMLMKNFTRDIEFAEKNAYTVTSDTITIAFDQYKDFKQRNIKWSFSDEFGLVEFDGKLHKQISDDIEVKVSPNDQVIVEVYYYSKGSSMENARNNADKIQYKYKMNAQGELVLDNYLSLPKGSKFRKQNVSVVVYIPKGKTLHTKNVDGVEAYDIQEDDIYYYDGENKYFKFVEDQFKCMNCTDDDVEYGKGYDDDDMHIIRIGGKDSANVKISSEGIEVKGEKEEVIINKQKVKITDGTDSVNIDISSN
jgi:phage shock protein PspC (stress-responsive transcriptional regulator)